MEVTGREPQNGQHKASAEDFLAFCHPCDNDGKRVQAIGYCQNCKEYLCDKCYNAHTSPTPMRHHVLLDTLAMPQPTSSMTGKTPAIRSTVTCPNHADKVVEFYCLTHNTSICGQCAFRTHKSCKVEGINQKSRNYKDSQEYTELQDTIGRLEKDLDFCLTNAVTNIKYTEQSSSTAIDQIRKFRVEFNSYLDQKESELLQTAKKVKTEDVEFLKKLEEECQSLKSKLATHKINLAKYKKNRNDLFATAKQASTVVKDVQNQLEKASAKTKGNCYTFQPDQALQNILSSKGSLGKLNKTDKQKEVMRPTMNMRATAGIAPVSLATAKMTKLPDTPVKSAEDQYECSITGAILLSPDTLLAVDYDNRCVKSIDTTTNTVTSRLALSSGPWDITVLPQGQAAVTNPGQKQIHIISTNKALSTIRDIDAKGSCYGITSTQDKLVVTYKSSGKVVVMDHYGRLLQTFILNNHGQPLFQAPEYATVTWEDNSEVIYVSDYTTNTTTKLSMEGHVLLVYKHQDLDGPEGLTITSEGNLLLCNRNNHNIHLVSSKGEKICTVLDKTCGIMYPYTVNYCSVQNKLYVSCCCYYNGGSELRNSMTVFKCE